jgi:2',3'-cyclic-nucleotide 2'-phosphodiesterase
LNILFVGDIFGSAGRRIVREHIGHVREAHEVELVVINAENAAGGFGVTPQIAEDLFDLGADVLTTGNHVWDKRELIDYMNSCPPTARSAPAACCGRPTCSPACPATASLKGTAESGVDYAVINLQGCVFMNGTNDPFHAATTCWPASRPR